MGKVKDSVKKHIKNGDVIACDVAADFAVVAGKGFIDYERDVDVVKRTEKKALVFPIDLYWLFLCMIITNLCITSIFWPVQQQLYM